MLWHLWSCTVCVHLHSLEFFFWNSCRKKNLKKRQTTFASSTWMNGMKIERDYRHYTTLVTYLCWIWFEFDWISAPTSRARETNESEMCEIECMPTETIALSLSSNAGAINNSQLSWHNMYRAAKHVHFSKIVHESSQQLLSIVIYMVIWHFVCMHSIDQFMRRMVKREYRKKHIYRWQNEWIMWLAQLIYITFWMSFKSEVSL